MPPTSAAEEIIEKKTGSPIATSCLILSVVAILGAIVLQLAELGEYRRGQLDQGRTPGKALAKKDLDKLRSEVKAIVEKKAAGVDEAAPPDEEATPPDEAPPKEETDGAKDEPADDAKAAPEEKPEEKPGEPAEPADEKPADGDAADGDAADADAEK